MTPRVRPLTPLFLLAVSCVTAAPTPDPATPGPTPAAEEDKAKPTEAPTPTGRSRFDLPGECSSKLAVSHGIADMAECEGPIGDTSAIDLEVKAIAADPDGLDARIQLTSGPTALADGTLHGAFSDGRPTDSGDLTFGRFSVDFGNGHQFVGFVLRERIGRDATWVFHIMGGSGCLTTARGELLLPERTKGTLKLNSAAISACAQPGAPTSSIPGLDLPALLKLVARDGGTR